MQRTSHAVALHGRVWMIDPVADETALGRARELGDPAGVVQLLDRHGRDCRAVAEQLGVPHYELPEQPPAGAPFEVLTLLRRRWRHEVALWYPEQRTLVCADAVGTAQYYRAPGERLSVSPLLRLTPPRRLLDFLDAEWGERPSVEALARLEVANREREVVDEDLGRHCPGLYFRPSDLPPALVLLRCLSFP